VIVPSNGLPKESEKSDFSPKKQTLLGYPQHILDFKAPVPNKK
jgi:hypothetical protein